MVSGGILVFPTAGLMGLFALVVVVRVVNMRERGTMRRIVLLTAMLAGLGMVNGCGDSQKSDAVTAAAQAPSQPAATSSAVTPNGNPVVQPPAADNQNFVNVSGPLIVEHQVDVTAQREGTVAKVKTEAGARVKAGTLLAQLDDRQIVANLEAGRAKS